MAKFSELERDVHTSLLFAHECFRALCLIVTENNEELANELVRQIGCLVGDKLNALSSEEFEMVLTTFIGAYDNLDSFPQGVVVIEIPLDSHLQNQEIDHHVH